MNPAPFLLAGILNVTPDSFSDGGFFHTASEAVRQAGLLADAGAHILDIGGESTRPGAVAVPPDEELARILPVVEASVRLRDSAAGSRLQAVSVDTRRAATARRVLEAGIDIINDVAAALWDPAMAELLAEFKPGYVLMHGPHPPDAMQMHAVYDNVVDTVLDFFERRMAALVQAGLPEDSIVLDPGIGFAKLLEHNIDLLRNISRFHRLGRPLYVGISRKAFLGELTGLPPAALDSATQTATALLAAQGVRIHRVHDVAGAVRALLLAKALTPPGTEAKKM